MEFVETEPLLRRRDRIVIVAEVKAVGDRQEDHPEPGGREASRLHAVRQGRNGSDRQGEAALFRYL